MTLTRELPIINGSCPHIGERGCPSFAGFAKLGTMDPGPAGFHAIFQTLSSALRRVVHPFAFSAKGWDCGTLNNFHRPHVTSALAAEIKSRNHGRGRDGWQRPIRYALKSFAV
jgi:hypothetical protein